MHADKNRIYKLKSIYLLKTIKKESQSRDPLTDGRMTRDRVKHKQKLRKLAAHAQLTSPLYYGTSDLHAWFVCQSDALHSL